MGDIWKSGIKYTGGGGSSSLPSGGTTGQVLAKKSDKSRDVEWKDEHSVDAQGIKNALGYTPADEDDVAKKYEKPSGGIPESDLAAEVVSEIKDHSDPEAVKFVDQTLTEDQKGTARSNIGAYAKPSTGISKADLEQGVQDSLGKADSALQSFTETDPTVPAWAKANTKPDYDYSEIQNTPEISKDVQADKTSDVKVSSPKSVKIYVDSGLDKVWLGLSDLKDKVGAVDIGEYVVAWDGESIPAVENIPYGVSVTYNTVLYTGELVASASTLQRIYLVATGTTDNYDRYITTGDSTYSWRNIGTTEIHLADYATKIEFGKLDAEVNGANPNIFDTLLFEQGGISSSNGSNQSSMQQVRSGFIETRSLRVTVTNGSVYVYGWNEDTYLSAIGWKTGTNDFEIEGATKYRVVFKLPSGNLTPEDVDALGASVYSHVRGQVVKCVSQSLNDSEKQQARMNIDALPASAEASIKAYSDAALLLNANKVAGKGETVVSVALVLMPNTRYKLSIPNPSWAYSGSQTKLQLKVTGGNQLFSYTGQQEVPRFIYFVTGNYTDFTLFVRANTGTDFTYIIENVDEVDKQFIMGAKPYFTPSRIEGGWRIVINSSTSLHPNWDQTPYTPHGETFDFTDTDKLLVFNQLSNEYALRNSTIFHGDTVLLDYRSASQNFVGGLFFPYFIQYGKLNYPEYATASGFDIDENGRVSWESLSLHKKDNTVATFTADSFVISSSSPALVLRSATGQIVTTALASIDGLDRILLALYDGMYFGMLAYLVDKKKLTSWYADEYELNIKRFGDQLKNVKWTPKADVRSNEGLNEAGVEVTGVPYSSVKEELKFVGIDVSLHTFMTAINDIHSLMYTENVNANGSRSAYEKTYHGVNSICYYGSVCSGFVTTAIGGLVQFNSWEYQTYPERFHIIEEQDEQNLKVGDIISEPGHCAIVTRLYRTLAGKITDIEVSEHGAPLRTTTYRLQSLIDRRRQTGIVYCRMNNRSWIDKYITYTPSPFVLADGEMLYTGGDFVYRDGATRTFYRCTQQNRDSSFVVAKWQSVPVFATGTKISVNNYRQYGERLYRCKVTHTPTEWDADKWEYVKGVKEWASYPYTYNDDIVTFAGDRAAFRLGEDIYINFVKGSYTKMQVYKEGTLLDELTLGDGYQLDITSLIVSPGLYKARLSDGTNFSRYTYFEVIDATVTATIENGVATVNYSSNYGTPIDAQIVELSGFPICHFAVDGGDTIKIDPQAGLYRQRHHYYGRYNNYSGTVYARVVFAGEYGNIASEMVSIGTLVPITGILVYPNETLDLGELSGANNIILTDGLVGKRYDFSFEATSGSSIVLRSVLGSPKWADSVPTLQAGKTYIFSVVNGIVRYEMI